jgi:hypothetical protein
MKINFQYNKEKDIWCILNKGKSSNNSQSPTKVYEELVSICGNNPTDGDTSVFIDKYISEKNISIRDYVEQYQKDWDVISDEYQKRAEKIFGVSIPEGVTAYLTVNNRCPYHIGSNYFFVRFPSLLTNKTIMHELWHFYTWYGLGPDQEEKLGMEKYNDLKESLTVLLNIECGDLLPEGRQDAGYPQHKELREKIVELWSSEKDIHKLWLKLVEIPGVSQ